jgi:UDP-N-acetylmuramyl pentapeptide synthase
MADLLLRDLVISAGGRLSLAAMPPRDGDLLMLRRSTSDAADVRLGDLYWALSGESDDGMRHVEEAFARGAAGAVISGRTIEPWAGKFTLTVSDVRNALWQAAAQARSRLEGTVIVVTGQSSVTSTSAAIHRVLASQLSGSLAVGTSGAATCRASDSPALGLLNAHPSHDYLVLGLDASDAVEVAQRCCPHACVLTHEATSGLIRILEALPESGWSILPGNDDAIRLAAQPLVTSSTRVIWYGRGAQNDLTDASLAVTALPAVALAKILNISDLSVSAALGNVRPNAGQPTHVRLPIATTLSDHWSFVSGH